MAKKTTTVIIDDLTGVELEDGGATVAFSLEGIDYEIDLGASSAASLRDAFRPYIEAGRRVKKSAAAQASAKASTGEQSEARAWFGEQGIEVPARGRLSADLMSRYRSR